MVTKYRLSQVQMHVADIVPAIEPYFPWIFIRFSGMGLIEGDEIPTENHLFLSAFMSCTI